MYLKNHSGAIITDVIAMIMGICMSIAAPIFSHQAVTWISFAESWAMTVLIILLVSWFLPYARWGMALAKKCHLKPDTFGGICVASIIPALIFNTLCTMMISASNIFYNASIPKVIRMHVWEGSCLKLYVPFLIVSYIASILAQILGMKLAQRFAFQK